jgi:hypothetical protein
LHGVVHGCPMRHLNSTNLIVMTPEEWAALGPHLRRKGYRWFKEAGQHRALWAPGRTRCVGEMLEGHFYLDARCLPDVPEHLRPSTLTDEGGATPPRPD